MIYKKDGGFSESRYDMTITSLVMSTDDSGDASLRLPVIAPKEDVYALGSGNSPSRLYVPARVRLPPRSKTGCWTCRSRKVKCDEARPTCGQCARLGHQCDYSPRLSFRDDTQRIMERMPDVSTIGSVVWDPSSQSRARRTSSNAHDELPPFASLTSDEERERKAESSDPGTYHVIVNPNSFSSLPEYADESAVDAPNGSHPSSRRNSANSSMLRNGGQHDHEGSIETDDPNVVILSRFEDTIYKSPATQPRKPQPSPASNRTSPASPTVPLPLPVDEDNRPLNQVTVHGSQEDKLLSHFRNVVWKQLNHGQPTRQFTSPLSSPMLPNVDVFQEVASMFRPLFHAIMAISALSLAHRDGGLSVDSLQHYQQAFPSLQECIRSDQDLCSDGVFLTHFLLLVYEVAAAQPSATNLWSQHISRLLQISLMRSTSFDIERYPYINWWICCIDLYGLLSGAGTGEFLAAMLKNDLVPSPECKLYPLAPRGCSVIYPEEAESLPAVLQLHHETFLYAAQLAFLAASLRGRTSHALGEDLLSMGPFSHSTSSEKLYHIQVGFQQLWESLRAAYLRQRVDSFPPRPRELFLNALTMYHACMIYSFTSMWPGQGLTSNNVADEVIERHVSAILQVAEDIVRSRRFDLRFILFPLLMAGYATARESVKKRAIELMLTMENDCVGRNATATRRILEIVSEQQAQQAMTGGQMLSVDWMEVMAENGLQVVDFGM